LFKHFYQIFITFKNVNVIQDQSGDKKLLLQQVQNLFVSFW